MIYVCKDCGSQEVLVKEWCNIHTGKSCGAIGDENLTDSDNNWCPECEEHVIIIEKKE